MKDETQYKISKVWEVDPLIAEDLRYAVATALDALTAEIQKLESEIKRLKVPAREPRSGIEVLDCDRQSWVEEKY